MVVKQAEKSDVQEVLDSNGIIYKHSPRCGMSASRKEVVEEFSEKTGKTVYLIDVLAQRDLSNTVAERTGVKHESPQLLILKDGEVETNLTHMSITPEELEE